LKSYLHQAVIKIVDRLLLLQAPIKRITAPHTPVPFSPPLEKLYLPTPEKVIETISEMIGDQSLLHV
ncbi:transketolase C-terminal domain-containing protein, partial [Bacillus sp. SS-TM]